MSTPTATTSPQPKTLRVAKALRVQASGVKNTAIDFSPAPVTIITGANYAGKSAYKIALELLLLGYAPGLGKTNGQIFELSDGAPMDLKLSLDDEVVIARSWTQNGKSVKAEKNVLLDVPPVMLDLGCLFDMPKAARLQYLFTQAKAGEKLSMETIAAAIKNVDVGEASEASEKAIQSAVAIAESVLGETIQDKLENILKELAAKLRFVSAELKDLEGFARVQTRQADLDTPVSNAKAKVAAARKALQELHALTAECERAGREYSGRVARLNSLNTHLQQSEDTALMDGASEDAIAQLQREMENIEAQIGDVCAGLNALDGEGAAEQVAQMREMQAQLSSESESLAREILAIRSEHARESSRYENAMAMECCPTCGADGVSWRDKMLLEIGGALDGLMRREDELSSERGHKQNDLKIVQQSLEAAQIVAATCRAQQEKLNGLQANLNRLRRESDSARQRAEANAKQFADLRAERDAICREMGDENGEGFDEKFMLAKEAEDAATATLAEADKEFQREIANRSNELERQKSIMRRVAAEAESAVLKSAGRALQELQKAAIADSFAPLLETARRFTDGILRAPLDFHESELGYWQGKKFVSHHTFSGSEEALAYVGLMVALANASDSPLKIAMIDELGRFDPETTRPKVVERMMELTSAGVLDYFIGIDPDTRFYEAYSGQPGVLVHHVGGAA